MACVLLLGIHSDAKTTSMMMRKITKSARMKIYCTQICCRCCSYLQLSGVLFSVGRCNKNVSYGIQCWFFLFFLVKCVDHFCPFLYEKRQPKEEEQGRFSFLKCQFVFRIKWHMVYTCIVIHIWLIPYTCTYKLCYHFHLCSTVQIVQVGIRSVSDR